MSRRIVRAVGLAALVATLLVGCSRKSMLPDAYFAEQLVPIYPHAELEDQMGSNSYGDGPDESWDGMAWWLASGDERGKIVAFYEAKLTGWDKESEEDGGVTFKTVPANAENGEEVYVRINVDGRIQIGESVKAHRKAYRS